MTTSAPVESIRVWDRFVRVFHWSLVASVFTNFFLVDDGGNLHQWIGYFAGTLVVARLVWGFVGPKYARFADFFPTPTRIRLHLQHLMNGERDSYAGHNPIGALMMFGLLAVVLALAVTGFMQTLDAFWGEEWLQEVHEALASLLIALAGLHAIAAIVMSHVERTNLIAAMVTGVKVRRSLRK